MAGLFLRPWWNRMAHCSRSGRRCADPPNHRRSRLHLEALEGRCLPSTVTNLDDAGAGSLRQAISDTPAGGTVDFQDGLHGTIVLTTGELDIAKELTIAGPGADVIAVSGDHLSGVFMTSATVAISGLTIEDGVDEPGGAGILNLGGTLTIMGCTVRANAAHSLGGGIANNGGMLTITDSVISGNSISDFGNGGG